MSDLIKLLEHAHDVGICGRPPSLDWSGTRVDDPTVTVTLRLTRADMAKIIDALKKSEPETVLNRESVIDILHRYQRGEIMSAGEAADELGRLQPYPIEFADRAGHPGKLKMRNGAWFLDGTIVT